MRKRVKINSIKGKAAKSSVYTTKIEAEISLHRFRFDTENNAGKESVLKRLNEIIENDVLPQAVEVLTENNSNESVSDITLLSHLQMKVNLLQKAQYHHQL